MALHGRFEDWATTQAHPLKVYGPIMRGNLSGVEVLQGDLNAAKHPVEFLSCLRVLFVHKTLVTISGSDLPAFLFSEEDGHAILPHTYPSRPPPPPSPQMTLPTMNK